MTQSSKNTKEILLQKQLEKEKELAEALAKLFPALKASIVKEDSYLRVA